MENQSSDMPESDLISRLRRLEDREILRELVARYCLAVDDRDLDNSRTSVYRRWRFRPCGGRVAARRRGAIRAFYSEPLAAVGPSFHFPHSQVVDFMSENEAGGIVTAHTELGVDGKCVVAGIRYHDQYVLSWELVVPGANDPFPLLHGACFVV